MSIFDRFFGLWAAAAYGLQRAKAGFLRLRVGVMLLCCFYAAHSAYQGWRSGFELGHGATITLCLALATALLWAHQHRYIVFREHPTAPTAAAHELGAEEKLRVHGSGVFQVSDMARYLVEVPVVFWTTQLADHIVAAQVRAVNVLGVGVPSEERGWWYIFLEPKNVVEIMAGDLYFGFGLRPAVRVRCDAQPTRQTVYLSCDSTEQRDRLLKELQVRARWAHEGTAWTADTGASLCPKAARIPEGRSGSHTLLKNTAENLKDKPAALAFLRAVTIIVGEFTAAAN